jgi:hypothetical protein
MCHNDMHDCAAPAGKSSLTVLAHEFHMHAAAQLHTCTLAAAAQYEQNLRSHAGCKEGISHTCHCIQAVNSGADCHNTNTLELAASAGVTCLSDFVQD